MKIPAEGPWPEDGLEVLDQCPVCGCTERALEHEGLEDRIFFVAPGRWDLWRCKACQAAYLDPRPDVATIGRAYEGYYTHDAAPDVRSMSLKHRIRRQLANGYRNVAYGAHETPASGLGVIAAALMPDMRATIDASMRHLPRATPGQRLLDVGCGNGTFLKRAQGAGWTVSGVDFDPGAVEAARQIGLDARHGDISAFEDEAGRFDVITLAHVLEHVHDPIAMLGACHRLLTPGGRLWIETPNIDAQGHRVFGPDWRGLEPPRHLVLFNLSGLTKALERTGFSDIHMPPSRPRCEFMFGASAAIARGRDPMEAAGLNANQRRQAREADRFAKAKPEVRELVTLIARRAR